MVTPWSRHGNPFDVAKGGEEDGCERKPKKKAKPVVIKAFEVFEQFRGTL